MTTATARYIQNGFTVNWSGGMGGAINVPANLYAASVPEIVYWLGRIFDPLADPGRAPNGAAVEPNIIESSDPLLGTEAQVSDVASGGFIVRQQSIMAKAVEVYCVDMDAVHGQLNLIFAPPPAPTVPAAEFTFAVDVPNGKITISGAAATHDDSYLLRVTTDSAAGSATVAVRKGQSLDEFGTALANAVGSTGTNCMGKFSTQVDTVTVTPALEEATLVALSVTQAT